MMIHSGDLVPVDVQDGRVYIAQDNNRHGKEVAYRAEILDRMLFWFCRSKVSSRNEIRNVYEYGQRSRQGRRWKSGNALKAIVSLLFLLNDRCGREQL